MNKTPILAGYICASLFGLCAIDSQAAVVTGSFDLSVDYTSIVSGPLMVGNTFAGSFAFDTTSECAWDGNAGHICGGSVGSPLTAQLSSLSLSINGTSTVYWSLSQGLQPSYQRAVLAPNGQTVTGLILSLNGLPQSDPYDLLNVYQTDWQYFNRYSGFSAGGNVVSSLAPIPEPESYALMAAGLGVLGAITRRRTN
jgi:hypothetical protein